MCTAEGHSNCSPVLGCIADDVTGATDLAINLVQGVECEWCRYLGVRRTPKICRSWKNVDAIVVALKTRSITAADAKAQSVASLRALAGNTVAHAFYFKYCSTFDSTPQGNIGPVAEALMDELGVESNHLLPCVSTGRSIGVPRPSVRRRQSAVGVRNAKPSVESDERCEPGASPGQTVANARWGFYRTTRSNGTPNGGGGSFESVGSGRRLSGDHRRLRRPPPCDFRMTQSASLPLVTGGSGLARHLPASLCRDMAC